MKKLILNQNIEVIDTAISEHLSDLVTDMDFIFVLVENTNTTKQYRLSYYVNSGNRFSPTVGHDGLPLHSQDIDDLGWINLRFLNNSKTELKILPGQTELNSDTADYFEIEVRLKTKHELIEELTERLIIDGLTENQIDIKSNNNQIFINNSRIGELKSIKNNNFDLTKLIQLCKEINSSFIEENFYSIAMLLRAILDHVPPIFGVKTFEQVTGQHGSKSFKDHMAHLDKSLRKIADSYLHLPIREKETLPNQNQINFSADLDVLLAEIVRILK